MGFHVSAEVVLRLRIGWFSYYMIVLACVFFLPSSVLWRLGAFVHRPAARLAAMGRDVLGGAGLSPVRLVGLAVVGVACLLVAIGWALDLPGAQIVGFLAAAALVAASVVMLVLRCYEDALRYALATGLAGVLMWVAIGQSDVRIVYHMHVGKDLQRRGDLVGALDAFERARRYAPGDKALERYERRLKRRVDRTEE